jgi:hypothetical protein
MVKRESFAKNNVFIASTLLIAIKLAMDRKCLFANIHAKPQKELNSKYILKT